MKMNIQCCYVTFIVLFIVAQCENIHERYEYKYSFKGPYLSQKDHSIPFWEYGGNAIASADRLRITPSLKSQKGYAWIKNSITFQWWSAEMVFRIIGERSGADGMAFWYTEKKGVEGPVFGSSDYWNGLGLFFDSYDNDQKRNNPYIMGMINDGSQLYKHESDGFDQKIGGCLRNFRNKAFPVRVKVQYYKNVLTVFYHNGDSDKEDYEICFRSENVHLPPNGYFGISGATGGLADDQDVLKFVVNSLRPKEEMSEIKRTQDSEKYQKEFEEYERKTKQAREEYFATHPDAKIDLDENEFLTPDQLMFNQLTDAVQRVKDDVRECLAKIDHVLGKQETTISLVSGGSFASTGGQPPHGGQLPAGSGDAMNNLLSGQRDLIQDVRYLRTTSTDIQSLAQQLLNRAQGSVQPAGGGSYDMHVTLKELNEGVHTLKSNLLALSQRMGGSGSQNLGGCPEVKCASTWVILLLMLGQLVVFVCYFMYRDSKEAQAKKFY